MAAISVSALARAPFFRAYPTVLKTSADENGDDANDEDQLDEGECVVASSRAQRNSLGVRRGERLYNFWGELDLSFGSCHSSPLRVRFVVASP